MALKLVITKGPRQGETLEYPPGSTIRIGRVVRGNNLTIKDSGISSKHLSIGSESGKWVLRDLDSSNGSFLNDQTLDPDVPVEIADGDCIKIGESTSISVKIEDLDESRLRRNPRRGAQTKENDEDSVEAEADAEAEAAAVPRRGRGRKARVLKTLAEEGEERLGRQRQVSTRRTRSSKNEENGVSCSVLGKNSENCDVEGGEVEVGVRKTRGGGARKRKNSPERVRSCGVEGGEVEDGGAKGRKNSPEKSPECVMIDVIDLVDDGSMSRLNLGERDCEKVVSELREKEDNGDACGVREVSDEAEKGSGSGIKESLDESGKEPDLEKMTLGEWFDYLEVDLSKQIVEATEEMIRGMRLKAERVREYMVEKRNEKAKVLVG